MKILFEEENKSVPEKEPTIEKLNSTEIDLNIRDLFKDYEDNNDFKEVDWGEPVGEEKW